MFNNHFTSRVQSANSIGDAHPAPATGQFQDHVPVHPCKRLVFETGPLDLEMRVIDLVTPVGKGQRGLIV